MLPDPLVTLTTDFGVDDPFAGVMKGVILRINPKATIIDLNHGIPSHDIRSAAFTVGMNYRFFPDRTVHVVVVDPGVGSGRRPLLVVTANHYFIGPDNGVFSYVYQKERQNLQVVHITSDHYFLKPKSPTFQGRDVFAPVAAWLSGGKSIDKFGETITDYCTIDLPMPVVKGGKLTGDIIHIDKFGNALSNISQSEIAALAGDREHAVLTVSLGGKEIPMKSFYGEASDKGLHAIVNSSEYVEFFVNQGSAAALFNISVGDTIEMTVSENPQAAPPRSA